MRKLRAAWFVAAVLPLVGYQSSPGDGGSRPIVDVRFDAPYQQIESSTGDEWAPTWAHDDALYTGNDDGTSFGGVESNDMAFGKLVGTDSASLKGATVSGMETFREPLQFGPEAAAWNSVDTLPVDGVRYRIMPCDTQSSRRQSCLAVSSDDGKSWKPGSPLAWDSSKGSSPSLIYLHKMYLDAFGDNAVADYLYAASYAGVSAGGDNYIVGRVPRAKVGDSTQWSFLQSDFSWGSLKTAGPLPNSLRLGPDGANWKLMNAYAVDGVLYMFITRCVYPWNSLDPQHRHWWFNASIIKSIDGGKTWKRPAQDNFDHPMFPGHRFATAYFVWYGKDGAASVDNADKYVYAVSNNGFFENGDDYVLGRVLRSRLPALSAGDWSFYQGGDGMHESSWTSSLDGAKPILVNLHHSSMTGVTYIPALGRYVLVVWHYHQPNFAQAIKAKDLGTVLEFYEAGMPWGPWTKVKGFDTGNLGWYTPIIGQRFQKQLDANSVTAILYATGFTSKPEGGLDPMLYKLDYMPITLSTAPLQHNDPKFVGQH
jgi:hypothetical protein